MAVRLQTQCVVYIANKTYKFTKSLHTYFFSTLYMYVYSDRKSGMYVYTLNVISWEYTDLYILFAHNTVEIITSIIITPLHMMNCVELNPA